MCKWAHIELGIIIFFTFIIVFCEIPVPTNSGYLQADVFKDKILGAIETYFFDSYDPKDDKAMVLITILVCYVATVLASIDVIKEKIPESETEKAVFQIRLSFFISFLALTYATLSNSNLHYYATILLGFMLLSLVGLYRTGKLVIDTMLRDIDRNK